MGGPRAPTRANGEHTPTVRARFGRRGFGMVDEPYADLRSKGGTIPILRAGPVPPGWAGTARARSFGNSGECIKRTDVGPEPDLDSRSDCQVASMTRSSGTEAGSRMGGDLVLKGRPPCRRPARRGLDDASPSVPPMRSPRTWPSPLLLKEVRRESAVPLLGRRGILSGHRGPRVVPDRPFHRASPGSGRVGGPGQPVVPHESLKECRP